MKFKPYIVATETKVTCVCMAKDKTDAVNKCFNQYYEESPWKYPSGPVLWEAYDFKEYFSDGNEKPLVLESIEW